MVNDTYDDDCDEDGDDYDLIEPVWTYASSNHYRFDEASLQTYLVCGFTYFLFWSLFGEDFPFD